MVKYSKTYFVAIIFLMFLTLISCKEKEVTITKDYVINPNWDERDNSFRVFRMNLKDSSDNINLKNVTPTELLKNLTEDTSFSYVANVKYNGEKYSERKVYFNKDNGFVWRKPPNLDPSRNLEYETIGELQQETWYFLGGLSNTHTLYYVYIDSLDSLNSFRIPASSWTNY